MKTLVVYYSNTGSNKYLAEKIAHALRCEIEAIKPRLNLLPFLMLFSLVKTGPGIKTLSHKVNEYDRILVCGPIWMGRLISPLRDFINAYRKNINRLYFASCCGSTDAAKYDTFGHAVVFDKVKNMLGDKCVHCEAFPIGLVLSAKEKEDGNAIMKARLSDSNFTGDIQQRFEDFIQKVAE
jgi:menaquinone-dependent protoporphyrinogen IX oxidase